MGKNGKDENGVDTVYTGGDLRHKNEDSKYGYDAKVSSDNNGNTNYYSSSYDWEKHSHDVSDIEKIEILQDDGYVYGSINYIRANGKRINWQKDFYSKLK